MKWEYKVLTTPTPKPDLELLGDQGWELIQATQRDISTVQLYLKRPLSEGAPLREPKRK